MQGKGEVIIEVYRVLKASALQQFKMSIYRNMFRFCIFVNPIFYGFILGMMYNGKSDQEFLTYVVFGSGIISFWGSVLFSSASDIDRERYMGTLEALFAAPAKFYTIILGKVIGNSFWGMISMGINVFFVSIAFSRNYTVKEPLLLIVTVVLMLVSFALIAMVMAGLFTLSRNARLVMNVLEYPIFILCGMAFPVMLLPVYIRPLSNLLSPTWVITLFRLSVNGGSSDEIISGVAFLALLTLVYGVLSFLLFQKIDYKARKKATLGVY